MLRHALVVAALLVALAPAGPIGCGARGMQRIEVPAAGVTMRYDLKPGATLQGRLRVGNTRTIEGAGTVSQALDCEVQLVVVDTSDPRGALVRATFSNIELDWGLPPSAPMSPEEFTRAAITRLQGMNVAFHVRDSGEIVEMPAPPQELPDVDKQFIDTVLDALEQAFFVTPDRAVKDDESWTDDETRGREGKLGRYVVGQVQTRVDGMFRDETRKDDLVRLLVTRKRSETITTKEGSRKTESESKFTVMFAVSGYLADLEGETRDFDPVEGMTFSKVRVTWNRLSDGTTAPEPTQDITDPCDPNYVGSQTCADGSERQDISDPCHPDYVGAAQCPSSDAGEPTPVPPPAGEPPKATATPGPSPAAPQP